LERIKRFVAIRNKKGFLAKPAIKIQTVWPAIKDDPDAFFGVFTPLVDVVAFNMEVDFSGIVEHDPDFLCKSPWERLVVYADGGVPKCINDPYGKDIIADANTVSLSDIWLGTAMTDVRRKLLQRKRLDYASCRACSYGAKTEAVMLNVAGRTVHAGERDVPEKTI
jgi:hypothetical protein